MSVSVGEKEAASQDGVLYLRKLSQYDYRLSDWLAGDPLGQCDEFRQVVDVNNISAPRLASLLCGTRTY